MQQHLVVIHAAFGFYEYMYLVEPWRITWRSSCSFFCEANVQQLLDLFEEMIYFFFVLCLLIRLVEINDNDVNLPQ